MSDINYWRHQCFGATPPLDQIMHANTAGAPVEAGVSTYYDPRGAHHTPASVPGPSAHTDTFPDPVSPRAVGAIRTVRSNHRASHRYDHTVFDRPGKKAPAEYEPDPDELQKRCRQRGGKDYAVAWIGTLFVDIVTVAALVRPLTMLEEGAIIQRLPRFKPAQGYDGFLERVHERFECGLCPDESRMHWKNKKDAVPHLRKFHFGLANRCKDW